MRLAKVQQLLEREGVRVPYSSLHRFAVAHCGFLDRRRITVRLEDPPPGLYAQVDFGRLGLVPDETGRRRLLWGLSVVLPCSRHQFLFVTFSRRLEDLIEGLQRVWTALRQVPPGTTVGYAELAARIGRPDAARAGTCGANGLAVAVPCHRVVRADGLLSGYRWGVERKRALLEAEGVAGPALAKESS